jgi:hypothetical protein
MKFGLDSHSPIRDHSEHMWCSFVQFFSNKEVFTSSSGVFESGVIKVRSSTNPENKSSFRGM